MYTTKGAGCGAAGAVGCGLASTGAPIAITLLVGIVLVTVGLLLLRRSKVRPQR